jgi:PAS domain-containing protein
MHEVQWDEPGLSADGFQANRPGGQAAGADSEPASALHLRALADVLPCMLFEADAQGAHIWSNEAWVRYTDLTCAELARSGWRWTLHPDDAGQDYADWVRAMATAGEYKVRQRIRRHDGQWR